MGELDLFKKKRKDKSERESDLFEEPDINLDSDLPVHEKFVDSRKLRKVKK